MPPSNTNVRSCRTCAIALHPDNTSGNDKNRCKRCWADYMLKWYHDHHEQVSAKNKARYKHNSEPIRRRSREWYYANRERVKARRKQNKEAQSIYMQRWRAENKEYRASYMRLYKQNNRLRMSVLEQQRKSRKYTNGGSFTLKDIELLYIEQKGLCIYCSGSISAFFEIDHMLPISRGGTWNPENLCLACPPCNRAKHTRTADEYRAYLTRLHTLP